MSFLVCNFVGHQNVIRPVQPATVIVGSQGCIQPKMTGQYNLFRLTCWFSERNNNEDRVIDYHGCTTQKTGFGPQDLVEVIEPKMVIIELVSSCGCCRSALCNAWIHQ